MLGVGVKRGAGVTLSLTTMCVAGGGGCFWGVEGKRRVLFWHFISRKIGR